MASVVVERDIVRGRGLESVSSGSTTSFGAIIAGALAASSTALVLALVGAGMGLAIATSSYGLGHAAAKFAASTAIWLVAIEWLSSGVGGYVTGRLRAPWVDADDEEAFFRDTVHGFLTWALTTIVLASVLAAAFTSALSGAEHAARMLTSASVEGAATTASSGVAAEGDYWADELLRAPAQTPPATSTSMGDARPELARIFVRGLTNDIPAADKDYAAQLIAARTGVDAVEAKKRVDMVAQQVEDAKRSAAEIAESTRKVAATTSLMAALALAIGAFIASAAAALGGQRRGE